MSSRTEIEGSDPVIRQEYCPDDPLDGLIPEERAARLVFEANRVAQTSALLQPKVLQYAAYCHPELREHPPDAEEAIRRADKKTIQFIESSLHVYARPNIREAQMPGSGGWYRTFAWWLEHPEGDPEDLVDEVFVTELIRWDHEFVVADGGRQAYPEGDPRRYRSHLCHYGLNGETTLLWEYDQLYADVTRVLVSALAQGKIDQHSVLKLHEVIEAHSGPIRREILDLVWPDAPEALTKPAPSD